MNIFRLDNDPFVAAYNQCNKHVVKMCLETAQLLSTAHRVLDGEDANPDLYKATHKNHPSAVWARENSSNYLWLMQHFDALLLEYAFRYYKRHASSRLKHIEITIGMIKGTWQSGRMTVNLIGGRSEKIMNSSDWIRLVVFQRELEEIQNSHANPVKELKTYEQSKEAHEIFIRNTYVCEYFREKLEEMKNT